MRSRLRRARASLIVLGLALLGAVGVYVWVRSFDPRPWVAYVLAAVSLVCPGLPAALMAGATLRRGDPYDVSHRYPSEGSGSVTPRE